MADDDLTQMRDDIYHQLRAKYMEDPESLTDGAKALLAIFTTTKYMDDYDALGDMFADMYRRVDAAEKLMDEIENGTRVGDDAIWADNMIAKLAPIDMLETAEQYTYLNDLVERIKKLMARAVKWSVNTYEKKNGLPLTDFRHPVDQFLDSLVKEVCDSKDIDDFV